MPGYGAFAQVYDALNTQADYTVLCSYICNAFENNNIPGKIVADLGCGTGDLTLMLAGRGFDMIAVDASADMLSELMQKKYNCEPMPEILILNQSLEELDLYGTIQGAVCTFDTLNHLTNEQMRAAINRAALFMERGGVFVFDVNTLYKHKIVLANNTIALEVDGASCKWYNLYNEEDNSVKITLEIDEGEAGIFTETFTEYYHSPSEIEDTLEASGFDILSLQDGERFCEVKNDTQRYIYTVRRR